MSSLSFSQVDFNTTLSDLDSLIDILDASFVDDISSSFRISDEFDEQLSEYRYLAKGGKEEMAKICEIEKEKTGITSLKIKYNKVFGFFFEVPSSQSNKLPEYFVRRQTLANAERFITPELKTLEEKILNAQHLQEERENEIFQELVILTSKLTSSVQEVSRSIASLDLVYCFSQVAYAYHFTRPEWSDDQTLFIFQGRHPVVEQFLKKKTEVFTPNDLEMNDTTFHLITGPNMAGKSTYLRQNALILYLAHVGSFVPAQKAVIPIVDRIFTRIGAGDSLSTGESTFLVEMQESSRILHASTEKSFVILDEIGRGTSTYDGLSIAWAITEFLHEKGVKTLFATHYHELIALADQLQNAKNASVSVIENAEQGVIFLHTIQEGGAEKSFGIEVARIAGLPRSVIEKSQQILEKLEQTESSPLERGNQISLFDTSENFEKKEVQKIQYLENQKYTKLQEKFEKINPENLTPLQAMEVLFELKKDFSDDQ